MIFLPTDLNLWYANKAALRGLSQGEVIYWVLRDYAEKNGFLCVHPPAAHVLHDKSNKLHRCAKCGFLFYKKSERTWINGVLSDKTQLIPRIEEL